MSAPPSHVTWRADPRTPLWYSPRNGKFLCLRNSKPRCRKIQLQPTPLLKEGRVTAGVYLIQLGLTDALRNLGRSLMAVFAMAIAALMMTGSLAVAQGLDLAIGARRRGHERGEGTLLSQPGVTGVTAYEAVPIADGELAISGPGGATDQASLSGSVLRLCPPELLADPGSPPGQPPAGLPPEAASEVTLVQGRWLASDETELVVMVNRRAVMN